jgi:hypothetical protein
VDPPPPPTWPRRPLAGREPAGIRRSWNPRPSSVGRRRGRHIRPSASLIALSMPSPTLGQAGVSRLHSRHRPCARGDWGAPPLEPGAPTQPARPARPPSRRHSAAHVSRPELGSDSTSAARSSARRPRAPPWQLTPRHLTSRSRRKGRLLAAGPTVLARATRHKRQLSAGQPFPRLVRTGSAGDQEPLVPGGHERSPSEVRIAGHRRSTATSSKGRAALDRVRIPTSSAQAESRLWLDLNLGGDHHAEVKVYIRIRPSLYEDADSEVHEAWRLEFGERHPERYSYLLRAGASSTLRNAHGGVLVAASL